MQFFYNHVELFINQGPIIFFDPRGTGESDKHLLEFCTLKQHIQDIETIRTTLKFPKLTLFATSYGGMVGMGYAIQYQKNIEKLILGVTAPSKKFISKAKTNLVKWGTNKQQKNGMYLLDGKVRNDNHFVEIFESLVGLYSIKVRQNPITA